MIKIHIPMIARSDVFALPSIGHLGVYASATPFENAVQGETVEFWSEAGLCGRGIITFIEQPGQCIRQDMQEFENWHKLHWVPAGEILNDLKALLAIGIKCPECGGPSEIIDSRKENGARIRIRKCLKCKRKWRTNEVYSGTCVDRSRSKQSVPVRKIKVQRTKTRLPKVP